MTQEIYTCQRCKGYGDGITVGEDPITGRILCGKCRDEEWLERTLGKNWGDNTVMTTDPHVKDPLPEPTLEEMLGEDGARRYREDEKKKDKDDDRITKLEEMMARILDKLEDK